MHEHSKFVGALAVVVTLCACGPKNTPILVGNNNDDPEDECRFNVDCGANMKCEAGECIVDLGTPNNSTNNPTNNATTPTNNTNNMTIPMASCEDPGDPLRFAPWEGTGINVEISRLVGEDAAFILGPGVALVDFNRDNDLDVMITNSGGELRYFTNNGAAAFLDVTVGAGLGGLTKTTSLSVADFDGDGDTDVVIGRIGGVYVMENQGDGTFVDETAKWGIGDTTDVVSSGSFADFDGDGDLDFYLASYTSAFGNYPIPLPNRLYRNDGSTFRELTVSPGGVDNAEGATLAVAWWDFDGDGRQDIWVVNDFGMTTQPNQLFRNIGPDPQDPDSWLFNDIAAVANLDIGVFGMSATLGDFDNDGDRDAYVANAANNVLHVVDRTSTTDEAVARGVASGVLLDPVPRPVIPPVYMALIPEMQAFIDSYADASSGQYTMSSWASIFFDADQDGWQDLWVSNGAIPSFLTPEASFQPNRLFVNLGGTFREGECWETPPIRSSTRGAAVGDLDRDGDMDIIWVDNGINGEPIAHVARNEFTTGNWLTVELRGVTPNTEAIGAKVTLVGGGLTQTRWIDGGQSFSSVSERVAHFGLGLAEAVDSLEVEWPNGNIQSVIVDAVNQRLIVDQL